MPQLVLSLVTDGFVGAAQGDALQTLLQAVGVTDRPPWASRGELRVYTRYVPGVTLPGETLPLLYPS